MSSGLRRSVSRWTFQVSASFAATLVAALIVQALPRPTPEAATPPEMTSGGKFAARVAAVRAYDGLDDMPLPHVDPLPAAAPATLIPAAFVESSPIAFGAASRQPGSDEAPVRERAKAARGAHAPLRADARRAAAPAATASAPVVPRDGTSIAATATEASDDGLLHQVASRARQVWGSTSATTRDAWSATASVGSSLVSRLLPE